MNTSLNTPLACALAALLAIPSAFAANGTWTALSGGNASGDWSTPGNWSGGTVASGLGETADFNGLNITTNSTVNLDTGVVIGNLIFGDTVTGTAASWIVSGANSLTLNGTTPTITVNALGTGQSVVVNSVVAGTDGLTKVGSGTLVLNNSTNSYTGTISNANMSVPQFGNQTFSTVVSRGRLVLGSATAAGTGNILVNAAGGGTGLLNLNGLSVANSVALNEDTYLYNSNLSTAATLGGNITLRNYARIGGVSAGEAGAVVVNGNLNFFNSSTILYAGVSGAVVTLNGSSNNGSISVQAGTLRALDGVNITSNSTLRIGFLGSGINHGGIFESSGNFVRSVGGGAGLVSLGGTAASSSNSTNIGFSAFGGDLTVALGGLATPSALTWGGTNFLEATSTMVLNAATANSILNFTNAVNLNGATRTIAVNASTALISGNLTNGSGTAGLIKTGNGTLSLTGTNTYNGDTTVSGGTLRVNTLSLPGNVTNNAALVFDQATNATYSGEIGGSGTVEKSGAGNLTLATANSYTGATLVSQGTLTLGNNSSLGTTAGNTTVSSGATLDLNGRNLGGELIRISGSGIGGNGAFVNNTGSASASQGGFRLELLADATIGGTGRFDTSFTGTVINGGTNTLTKTGANQFTINVGTTSMGTFNINQGSVVVVNSGTPFGDTAFGTNVAGGASLQFFNSTGSEIGNSENINLANGAELASTTATSVNSLNGTITLAGGNATIRVEASGVGTLRINGSITGAGGLSKTSAGTLLLTAASDYAGGTSVIGGTLLANNTTGSATGSGAVLIGAVGTLAGTGTLSGEVIVDGTLNPGNSPGTLNFGDDLTLGSSATLNLEITGIGGGEFDILNGDTANLFTLGGTLALNNTGYTPVLNDSITVFTNWDAFAGSFTSITGTDLGGGLYWDTSALASTGSLTVIPEPGTWALLLTAGTYGVIFFRRRRK